MDKATRILAVRDHSEWELRRKLQPLLSEGGDGNSEQANITPADIDDIIAWCTEHHWLDDTRFAGRFVISRSRKGYGPQRIRQELQQKGISRDLCDAALASDETNWGELARDIAQRKFGEPLPTEWPQKAKVQRFLLYRGFLMEDIQDLYRNFID